MPRVHSQVARKDYPEQGIVKGQTYYKWTTRPGGRGKGILHRSATYPKPQQLTSSPFLIATYDIADVLSAMSANDGRDHVEAQIEQAKELAEELRDETQDKLDNMPESLQYAPTGEMLQERVDAVEAFISELEGIVLPDEVDEPGDEPEEIDEPERDDYESREDYEQAMLAYEDNREQREAWQEEHDAYEEFLSQLDDAVTDAQGLEIEA